MRANRYRLAHRDSGRSSVPRKDRRVLKKLLLPAALLTTLFSAHTALAADECKSDGDCKDGKVCILALNPHVCKPPQPAGAACKRDVVCASKKCEIPAGKDVGACK